LIVGSDARDDTFRLAHPLFGDVIRARLPRTRAQARYRRLFELSVASDVPGPEDDLRWAVWLSQSGAPITVEGVATLMRGARVAQYAPDFPLAEELARLAASIPSAHRFAARLLVAHATRWGGRPAQAEEMYAELFESASNDDERVRVLNVRAFGLHFALGRRADAAALLDRAEQLIISPSMRALVPAIRGAIALYSGDMSAAVSQSREVLAHEGATRFAVHWAGTTAVSAAASIGDASLGSMALARLEQMHAETGASPFERATAVLVRHELLLTLGRLAEACERAARYQESIIGSHDSVGLGVAAFLRASGALAQGQPRLAARLAREALSEERMAELGDLLARAGVVLALSGALLNDEASMTDGVAALQQMPTGFARAESGRLLAHAWLAAARDETAVARSLAIRAAEQAETAGQHAAALVAAHDALRLGDRSATGVIATCAPRIDGDLAPLMARHATATLAADGRALDQVSVAFELLGFLLHAADASAQAADAHRAVGSRASALAAGRRAEGLRAACDGACTPALVGSRTPLPLTQREREIATLAAKGLSNREIAARLFVGVRTVEGHLNRVFPKLGITRRRDLVPILAADDAPPSGVGS
jgi:ATP/maltotriose-dependent transcriptional regulator MalT